MKRFATMIALSTCLAAAPAMAEHEGGGNLLNRENVGGAIGATVGGFLGSKVGDGRGRLAATAAGAVGGFLLGENIAKNYGRGGYAGSHRTAGYAPADTYPRSGGYAGSGGYDAGGGYRHATCCDDDRDFRDRIRPINETFTAKCTSNVRSGPSTGYRVVGQLHEHERVQVVGKVRGRNWYMVRSGHRRGFVYAPLLRPTHYGSYRGNDRW